MMTISVEDTHGKLNIVNENDLVDFLPLLQGYCKFYYQTEEIPRTSDELLLSVSRALIANPKQEEIKLLARHVQDGKAVYDRCSAMKSDQ